MGKFVITKKPCGKYQVILKSKAGNILLLSSEYTAKISCKKTIELLRIYSQDADKYQKKQLLTGNFIFILNLRTDRLSVQVQSTLALFPENK